MARVALDGERVFGNGGFTAFIFNLLAFRVYLNGMSGTPARAGVLDLWVCGSSFELRHTQKAGF
jgi:hypothetical protein